jgi:hypothetical protein
MEQLSESVKTIVAITPTAGASGTTAITGQIVDTQGYSGVLVTVVFGAIVAGAATSIKFQQSDDPAMAGAADLAGTGQTILDTADDSVAQIDLNKPTKRYLRLMVSRGTSAATIGSALYQLYGGRQRPPAGQAGTIERFLSPPEGAA